MLLTSLPLFHTNALNTFYQALLTGAVLVVEPRFSASGFAASLSRHGATVTYLLGAMVPILLSRPASELDRAHGVRIALAPGVPERFHPEFLDRFGIALLDGYGSTETNFVLGCTLPQQRPGAMGPVSDGFEARVVDDADNALPDGVAGELVLRAESRSLLQPAISACRRRRSRRGGTSGSILAIASCATLMGIIASSTE